MKTSLFDFDLPESLIATHPAEPRDAARMLVLPPLPRQRGRVGEGVIDSHIRNLCDFLRPGDVLVFNDTRVIPARLFGQRGAAKVEVLLHKRLNPVSRVTAAQDPALTLRVPQDLCWLCFARPTKKLKPGDRITFAEDFAAEVMAKCESGELLLRFISTTSYQPSTTNGNFYQKLERHGHIPLPPYIRREDVASDRERYQTVYAKHDGSVAAPTAGLHFTESLLKTIDDTGAKRVSVTLHVGGGTFLPVKADDTENHVMHSEYAIITKETAHAINRAKAQGGRVIAVGTTSLRTLESAADAQGKLQPFSGETDIFITPGYQFKIVDMLLTNFHLPRSTLFMLVCAFAGLERMKSAYAHAIAERYRFYSYGDACLLFRNQNAGDR